MPQLRHFAFKHPVFRQRAAKNWWENNVYYFWWEFLRLHEGYKKTCEAGGKGQYAKLYRDFGDVHADTFQKWWTHEDRGARLFAEPPLPQTVEVMSPDGITRLPSDWDQSPFIIVGIPLTLRKRLIQESLTNILDRHHTRKRGQRTFKDSNALYPIVAQFSIAGLRKILAFHRLKQEHPGMPLWQLAQELGLGEALTADELKAGRGQLSPTAVSKKNALAVAAAKKLKSARNIIKGVGEGQFPTF